jgi:hypothetical protein
MSSCLLKAGKPAKKAAKKKIKPNRFFGLIFFTFAAGLNHTAVYGVDRHKFHEDVCQPFLFHKATERCRTNPLTE